MPIEFGSVELEFISKMAKLSYKWGLGEAVGKILGVLLLSEEPLTQRDLAEITGYSVGVVSSSLTILERLGLVVYEKIKRRKMYRAVGSLLDVLEHFIDRVLRHQLMPTIKFIQENLPKFSEKTRVNIRKLLQEYQKARILLDLNIRFLRKWKKLPLKDFEKELSKSNFNIQQSIT